MRLFALLELSRESFLENSKEQKGTLLTFFFFKKNKTIFLNIFFSIKNLEIELNSFGSLYVGLPLLCRKLVVQFAVEPEIPNDPSKLSEDEQ